MVPASLKGKYVIRFTVTSQKTTEEDIVKDWNLIAEAATGVLNDERVVDGVETIDEVFEEEVDDDEDVAEEGVGGVVEDGSGGGGGNTTSSNSSANNNSQSMSSSSSTSTASAASQQQQQQQQPMMRKKNTLERSVSVRSRQRRVSIPKLKDINKKNEEFGLSLMLSNVPGGPMSPKFINGTYAALFEEGRCIT